MEQIFFKKQAQGMFRRDKEGEPSRHVTREEMHNEAAQLIQKGWKAQVHGVTYLRGMTLTSNI